MTLTDNTEEVDSLLNFQKLLGKSSAKAAEKLAGTEKDNRSRTFEFG